MRFLLITAMALSLGACSVDQHYPNDSTAIKGSSYQTQSQRGPAYREMAQGRQMQQNRDSYSTDHWAYRPCTPHRVRQGVCHPSYEQ